MYQIYLQVEAYDTLTRLRYDLCLRKQDTRDVLTQDGIVTADWQSFGWLLYKYMRPLKKDLQYPTRIFRSLVGTSRWGEY